MSERLLKTSELAEELNCSRSFVHKLIQAESVRAIRLGNDYRIPASEAARLKTEGASFSDRPSTTFTRRAR